MANKDDINESCQALFCALADYCGSSYVQNEKGAFNIKNLKRDKTPMYLVFESMWNEKFNSKTDVMTIENVFNQRLDSPKVTFKDLQNHLMNSDEWLTSSVLIAKEVISEIQSISQNFAKIQRPSWKNIFYIHKGELMQNIEALWKEANIKQKNAQKEGIKTFVPFGDVNKWNPADIYFSSEKAEKIIKNLASTSEIKNINFLKLNAVISDLIDSGDLLPLSLKKQTSKVNLKKVNFDKKSEWKELEKYTFGSYKWTEYPTSASLDRLPEKPPARDMKIYLTGSNNDKDAIVLRHDASTTNFKGEIVLKGMEARAGSLGMEQIMAILDLVKPGVSSAFKSAYDLGNRKFKTDKKPIREKYEKEIKRKGIDIKTKNPADKKIIGFIRKSHQYDEKLGLLSAQYVTNPMMKILVKEILKDKELADNFVKYVYSYAASQSYDSCKFVIAK